MAVPPGIHRVREHGRKREGEALRVGAAKAAPGLQRRLREQREHDDGAIFPCLAPVGVYRELCQQPNLGSALRVQADIPVRGALQQWLPPQRGTLVNPEAKWQAQRRRCALTV